MLLEVRVIASPLVLPPRTRTRIGLIVPRYQQSAVARNRVKRRLRELCRTRLLPADIAADLVIRIRSEAYGASFPMLAADVEHILARVLSWQATEAGHSAVLDRTAAQLPDDAQ